MESNAEDRDQMIPFLTVMSTEFDNDLNIIKLIMNQFEKKTHVENAYRFSDRAEMAAGWWFYDIFVTPRFLKSLFQIVLPAEEFRTHDKKYAASKIIRMFQDQLKSNGSEARIKMYGDMPFAAPWWAWLMK